MDLDAIKDTFFAECSEQLSELENGLFSLTPDDPDLDIVNSVFRAVHSIKGGAGAFSLTDIVSFAHVFENALDIIRNDLTQCTEGRLLLLSKSADLLADIVAAARDGVDAVDYSDVSKELEQEFNLAEEQEEEVEFDAVPISLDDLGVESETADSAFQITFRPKPELYACGHDPRKIFRELAALGTLDITCHYEDVPTLDAFDIKNCYLWWEASLSTENTIDDINAIFEWVDDLCDYSVDAPAAGASEMQVDIGEFLGDFNIEVEEDDEALLSEVEEPAAPEEPAVSLEPEADTIEPNVEASNDEPSNDDMNSEETVAPLANEHVAEEQVSAEATANAPAELKKSKAKKESKPIRVDSEKVDRLINLMGELVISQSMLTLQIEEAGHGNASSIGLTSAELQTLTREIQSSVMAIRAQPIKPVFMRMSRVVREVCSATGKSAKLVLDGEQTEVDTTVIEGLSDPLTHMVRNSVDHGIESVEDRIKAGKPEQGTIKLAASHGSGRIVIDIIDDGAGINREAVLKKAIEKGIVSAEARLSDDEIDNLIFAPGFSTAETITDVSGRGVGMDVVRNTIQSLGGRVSITSEPGKGSHFSFSLPLTLAILDGMLVREAAHTFVLPVNSIVETTALKATDVFPIGEGQLFYKLRDQLLPMVDVGHELGFAEKRTDYDEGTVIIGEYGKNAMCAFVVDAIEGQQQVVIKSMESNYQRIPCIAAATILGNGKIALILDVEEMVTRKVQETPPTAVLEMIA